MLESICYNKNFISTVICRIDFSQYINDDAIENVLMSQQITDEFPFKERDQIKENANISVIDNPSGKTAVSKSIDKFVLKTRVDSSGKNKLMISNRFIILEYNQYDSFDVTKNHLMHIINRVEEKEKKTKVGRFGLRYINLFDIEKDKINKNYFSEMVKGLVKVESFNNLKLSRAMATIEFVNDDIRLIMKYGNFNRNYPGIIEKYDFVLDYDASIEGLYSLSDISHNKLDDAHYMIQSAFENCITDKLRKVMDEKTNEC